MLQLAHYASEHDVMTSLRKARDMHVTSTKLPSHMGPSAAFHT